MAQDTSQMQNPFMVGDRIYLRPLEPAQDNHLYATWMNDEEIRRDFSIRQRIWKRIPQVGVPMRRPV